MDSYESYAIKKPRKAFQNKEQLSKYIESFRTKYKTEMCKYWELNGDCMFKENCAFAHGPQELNNKAAIPKNYKTKLCKRFHEELYCPYGPRCQFKHSEDDKPNA
jgi:butyrate response factor 1